VALVHHRPLTAWHRAIVWGARTIVAGAALALAGALVARPGAGAEVRPGAGTATSYDSVDGGNCSFPGPPADHLDLALSHVEYGTADACGGYLDVVGPDGSVRVLITNQCPECPVGHIDLSRTAFARIARLERGQVPVTYRLVRNPPVARPIAVRVKTGSSRWWMQIQAIDAGNPIGRFELASAGGWRSLVHTGDNYWMAENPGPGDGPFTVRITDIYGQSVTIGGVALAPDQVQRTQARLYGAGAAAPAPATAGAPPAPPTTAAPAPAPATAPATTGAPTAAPSTTPPPATAAPAVAAAGASGGAGATTGDGIGASTVLVLVGTCVVLGLGALALRQLAARRPPHLVAAQAPARAPASTDAMPRAARPVRGD
jgi:expansin (peptidoglycan-binding protein)